MHKLILVAGAVYLFLLLPAWGQQPCADRADVMRALDREYGEKPILRAMDGGGVVVEITASPAGSWSMLVTRPGGPTCMRGSGEALEMTPHETAVPGKPS